MVKIRPLEEHHAETSYQWRNNPEIWKYTFNRPDRTITPEIEKEWIRKVIRNKNERRFAIYYGNDYVGNIYLTSITVHDAYYGIFLGDLRFAGKGIAMEASRQIIDYAKNELHLAEIFLRVKKENKAAYSLYLKLGFQVIESVDDYYKMSYRLK